MAGKNIKAGKAEVEIGIRSRIAAGAKQVEADLKKLGGKISGIGRSMATLATAASAPLAGMTLSFASAGDNLDKMSKRTGVGVKALSELAFAAEQSGASLDSVEKGIRGMQRSLLNAEMGSKAATDALTALGLSVEDVSGMSPEDQFTMIADAIAGVEDPSKRAALSMQLFGRAGSELLPMMNENADGIAKLRKEANELGRTMTEEDAKAAADLTDSMNRVKSVLVGVKNQIGAALAPAMTYLADLISKTSSAIVPLIKENAHLVKLFAAGAVAVGGLGAALVTVGGLVTAAGVAIGALFSPIGLAIGGITALGFALVKYTDIGVRAIDALKTRFGPLVKDVQNAVGLITEALKAGDMEKAWELVSETLEMVWLDMTEEIRGAWLTMLDFILNTGSSIAEAIGRIFQGLARVLDRMLAYYKKVYDFIYDGILDLGGSISGVRTIGERSSGFDANMGGVKSAAQTGIKSLRQFGIAMEEEAAGQKEARQKQRDEDAAARQQRRNELGKIMQQEFKATQVQADERTKQQNNFAESITVSAKGLTSPEAARTGASGTFSAFGAMVTGMTPPMQKVSDPDGIKEQKIANRELAQIKRHIKNMGGGVIGIFAEGN